MNVLLVDDDRFVIEALRRGIDWETLGIKGVFTAFDIINARRILKDEQIDLLLSDIDMPHGSGLELLSGMREEGNDIPAVFLTNYADFSYAKKALELKSFHYFLKPIDYGELTEIIKKALAESAANTANTKNALSGLWRRYIVDRSIHADDFIIESGMLDSSIRDYREYICILFNVYPFRMDENNRLKGPDTDTNDFGRDIRDLFRSVYGLKYAALNVFIPLDKEAYKYITLLPLTQEYNTKLRERIGKESSEMTAMINKRFDSSCSFYISSPVSIEMIPDTATRLNDFNLAYPGNKDRVIMVSPSFEVTQHTPPVFDKDMAVHALETEDLDLFSRTCTGFLDSAASRNSITGALITDFHIELNQIIYSYLMKKGVLASRLFQNEPFHFLNKSLHISTYYMDLYIRYMVSILHRYLDDTGSDDNVTDQLLKYVDDHFCEDISREELSDMFFFDPDYITRIFKKETGMSFKNYLIDKRLTLARKMLSETTEPVHEISLRVGYDNYSYFTRLFKKTYGVTPAEFRSG